MTEDQPGPALWDFSLALYAREPVKLAALALQESGLDVNLAFWIVWLAAGRRDPQPSLGEAMRVAADWHALAVGPLRGVRDRLKVTQAPVPPDGALALRRQVLAAELEAERIAQTMLEGLPAPVQEGRQGARDAGLAALEHYAARQGMRAPVHAFIEAVFSALEKE